MFRRGQTIVVDSPDRATNCEKDHECETCGKTFLYRGNLKKHLVTHTGERPYACGICERSFTQKSSLNTHYSTHTNQKTHTCLVCNRKFSHKEYLKKHLVTHTGNKPYACSICDRRFTQRSSLNTHYQIHTNQKKNTCLVCGKKFTLKVYLQKHLLTHVGEHPDHIGEQPDLKIHGYHSEKPFECNICNKSPIGVSSLESHTKCTHSSIHECVAVGQIFGNGVALQNHCTEEHREGTSSCTNLNVYRIKPTNHDGLTKDFEDTLEILDKHVDLDSCRTTLASSESHGRCSFGGYQTSQYSACLESASRDTEGSLDGVEGIMKIDSCQPSSTCPVDLVTNPECTEEHREGTSSCTNLNVYGIKPTNHDGLSKDFEDPLEILDKHVDLDTCRTTLASSESHGRCSFGGYQTSQYSACPESASRDTEGSLEGVEGFMKIDSCQPSSTCPEDLVTNPEYTEEHRKGTSSCTNLNVYRIKPTNHDGLSKDFEDTLEILDKHVDLDTCRTTLASSDSHGRCSFGGYQTSQYSACPESASRDTEGSLEGVEGFMKIDSCQPSSTCPEDLVTNPECTLKDVDGHVAFDGSQACLKDLGNDSEDGRVTSRYFKVLENSKGAHET